MDMDTICRLFVSRIVICFNVHKGRHAGMVGYVFANTAPHGLCIPALLRPVFARSRIVSLSCKHRPIAYVRSSICLQYVKEPLISLPGAAYSLIALRSRNLSLAPPTQSKRPWRPNPRRLINDVIYEVYRLFYRIIHFLVEFPVVVV